MKWLARYYLGPDGDEESKFADVYLDHDLYTVNVGGMGKHLLTSKDWPTHDAVATQVIKDEVDASGLADGEDEVFSPDATVENHGTIFTLGLVSDAAREWAEEHLPSDVQRIGTSGIVVEHRYIEDIVDGMRADGLVVE